MTHVRLVLAAALILLLSALALAVPPTLILKNQYGEVSKNYVIGGTFTTVPGPTGPAGATGQSGATGQTGQTGATH